MENIFGRKSEESKSNSDLNISIESARRQDAGDGHETILNEGPQMNSSLVGELAADLFDKLIIEKVKTQEVEKKRWTLWKWESDGRRLADWEEALMEMGSFDSGVEYMLLIDSLNYDNKHALDYCIFKEGIKPMWEDSRNIKGGKWTLSFPKVSEVEKVQLKFAWHELIHCMVTGGFGEFDDEICGIVLNLRFKGDRICLWTRDAENTFAKLKIGEILKLRTHYYGSMRYENHLTTRKNAELKGHNNNTPDKHVLF